MEFHIFCYLTGDYQSRVEALIKTSAVPSPGGYKHYIKDPEAFLQHLRSGVYTDFEEIAGRPRPLATVVGDAGGAHTHFTLELAGAFSPERKRLQGRSRNDEQEKTLRKLAAATYDYAGKHGFSSAAANQTVLADAGLTVLSLAGEVLTDAHARHYGRDLSDLRAEQLGALLKILALLEPHYALAANQDDYELWHMGPIEAFPPLAPWNYLWSFMLFGPQLTAEKGQGTLMRAPASKVYLLGASVALRAFGYTFHLEEEQRPDYTERERRACELIDYLGVSLPYETFVSAKGLSCGE